MALPDPFVTAAPASVWISSGFGAARQLDDGTLVPRARINWDRSQDPLVLESRGRVEVQLKRGADDWQDLPAVQGAEIGVFVEPVIVGEVLLARARFVNNAGAESAWTQSGSISVDDANVGRMLGKFWSRRDGWTGSAAGGATSDAPAQLMGFLDVTRDGFVGTLAGGETAQIYGPQSRITTATVTEGWSGTLQSCEIVPIPNTVQPPPPPAPDAPYDVSVTGALAGGAVWGANPYTSDSTLAIAAVHAGLVTPGQTAVIRVTPVGTRPSYPGITANGVTSLPYNASWPGIFLSSVSAPPPPPPPVIGTPPNNGASVRGQGTPGHGAITMPAGMFFRLDGNTGLQDTFLPVEQSVRLHPWGVTERRYRLRSTTTNQFHWTVMLVVAGDASYTEVTLENSILDDPANTRAGQDRIRKLTLYAAPGSVLTVQTLQGALTLRSSNCVIRAAAAYSWEIGAQPSPQLVNQQWWPGIPAAVYSRPLSERYSLNSTVPNMSEPCLDIGDSGYPQAMSDPWKTGMRDGGLHPGMLLWAQWDADYCAATTQADRQLICNWMLVASRKAARYYQMRWRRAVDLELCHSGNCDEIQIDQSSQRTLPGHPPSENDNSVIDAAHHLNLGVFPWLISRRIYCRDLMYSSFSWLSLWGSPQMRDGARSLFGRHTSDDAIIAGSGNTDWTWNYSGGITYHQIRAVAWSLRVAAYVGRAGDLSDPITQHALTVTDWNFKHLKARYVDASPDLYKLKHLAIFDGSEYPSGPPPNNPLKFHVSEFHHRYLTWVAQTAVQLGYTVAIPFRDFIWTGLANRILAFPHATDAFLSTLVLGPQIDGAQVTAGKYSTPFASWLEVWKATFVTDFWHSFVPPKRIDATVPGKGLRNYTDDDLTAAERAQVAQSYWDSNYTTFLNDATPRDNPRTATDPAIPGAGVYGLKFVPGYTPNLFQYSDIDEYMRTTIALGVQTQLPIVQQALARLTNRAYQAIELYMFAESSNPGQLCILPKQ